MAVQIKICTLVFTIYCILLLQESCVAKKNLNELFLGCGSSHDEKDTDGRNWEPDLKYIISGDKSNAIKAEYQDPSLPSTIPYMNARIFTSETSYQFPLGDEKNRTLLRLHFYPSLYPNFNVSDSYFSVIAGGITLLNNFSALITTKALSQSYITKEYLLASFDTPTLKVTFKPSDMYNPCFAFVNGIEVLQIPDLFDEDPKLASSGSEYDGTTVAVNNKSLETLYRLNVGGNYIAPSNDSGNLMRSWYDDSPYVLGLGVTDISNITIGYQGLSSYIAPLDVYQTSRLMGPSAEANEKFNLTWVFQVQANFSYVVRLHWCDYHSQGPNDRAFNIYINNVTAENAADVYLWTGHKAYPSKKDYIIYVNDKQGDEELRIELHPSVESKSFVTDAFLNGLEIFKLSDSKANLAGPNPSISDMMSKYLQNSQGEQELKTFASKNSDVNALIGGTAGGAAVFGVAIVAAFVVYNRKRALFLDVGGSSWLPIYGNSNTSTSRSNISGKSHGSTNISSDAACNCRYFSLAEIKQATKNFDESNVIGVGGFGKVYKGIIDGNTMVAIKRSNPSSEQGVHEFQTEIELLSKLRHRHLVSLIGFCEEDNEMALVYDYMGQGTFREHLYKGNKTILSWKQRLEICIGAARGLHYLHTGAKYMIIHRDVKTTNILLDDNWVAKVSDFGLSKAGSEINQGHVSTVVKGSFGYLDPEYFRRQQLTEKSDVYSFGVVLFEALCSRPALNPSLPKEQVSLADWALHCQRKGCLVDIIDPQLKEKITPACFKKFAETAEKCLADHGVDRPSMGDVLWNLEFALQLQENPDGPKSNMDEKEDVCEEMVEEIDHKCILAMHRNTLSLESDMDISEISNDNTSDIFSQIVNTKGR